MPGARSSERPPNEFLSYPTLPLGPGLCGAVPVARPDTTTPVPFGADTGATTLSAAASDAGPG
jgi:hypothetical protein